MPANLKDLRSRIKSVKNTQQITKAMKLVSAAKFGRAQTSAVRARTYSTELAKLMQRLLGEVAAVGKAKDPRLKPSKSKNSVLVVVSSERGLCGGFNSHIAKAALRTYEDMKSAGQKPFLVFVGKKALQIVGRRLGVQVSSVPTLTEAQYVQNPSTLLPDNGLVLLGEAFDKQHFDKMARLTYALVELFTSGKIGKIEVLFNRFQSAMTQTPTVMGVLPVTQQAKSDVEKKNYVKGSILFEPELEHLIAATFPRYLSSQMHQALLESFASEHGARMTAMDNATRNAKEMQKKLEITYQRARQAAITKELIEIVSGAEAL